MSTARQLLGAVAVVGAVTSMALLLLVTSKSFDSIDGWIYLPITLMIGTASTSVAIRATPSTLKLQALGINLLFGLSFLTVTGMCFTASLRWPTKPAPEPAIYGTWYSGERALVVMGNVHKIRTLELEKALD